MNQRHLIGLPNPCNKMAAAAATTDEVTLITTDHWLRCWFTQLILPTSRYAHAQIEFVDIAEGSVDGNIEKVCEAINRRPGAVISLVLTLRWRSTLPRWREWRRPPRSRLLVRLRPREPEIGVVALF